MALSTSNFPRPEGTVRGRWAPIYLSPILGSPERFIIAVAAVGLQGFHIEAANALNRLECLYGVAAETALFAAEVALDELRTALATQGSAALAEGLLVFSGVSVGTVAEGEARSLEQLAKTWMGALSSLYRYEPPLTTVEAHTEDGGAGASDRLPILVLEHVKQIAPRLSDYFSEHIRAHRRRRGQGVARISIDFAGPKLVANFATLQASTQAQAVDLIKRKMFDLKVRRDEDKKGLPFEPREHEMIIFTPPRDSPLLTEKQIERLDEALHELGEQSEREGFVLQAMHAVPEIGQRLLQAEGRIPLQ
ncbi:hypothetical protein ACFW16_14075 [Inquilinus sp. NPDC058860]|uniref:hypothetical protein n=1 Tax=Inquilinus sp. NPDC058860 TaxID=3346652 RepID=UPI0036C9396D